MTDLNHADEKAKKGKGEEGLAPPLNYSAPGPVPPGHFNPWQTAPPGGYGYVTPGAQAGGFGYPGQAVPPGGYGNLTPGTSAEGYVNPGPTGFQGSNPGYQQQSTKKFNQEGSMSYAGYPGMHGAYYGQGIRDPHYRYATPTNYPYHYPPQHDHSCYHHPYYYRYGYNPYYGGAGYGMNPAGPGYGDPCCSGAGYGMNPGTPYGYQPIGFGPNIFTPGYFSYMLHSPRVNNFFRAIGILTVGMLLIPSVARAFRPLAVSAVEGALTVSQEVKNIFNDAREDVEDMFAEAKWKDGKEAGKEGNQGS